MSDTPLAEAAVDATLNVVDEVTRLTVELATLRDTHARELQSVAEAVREACIEAYDRVYVDPTIGTRAMRAIDLAPIVARVLGGGR